MELKEFCKVMLLKVENIRLSSADETAEFVHKYNKLLHILSSDIEKMQKDLKEGQPGEKSKSKIPKKKKSKSQEIYSIDKLDLIKQYHSDYGF